MNPFKFIENYDGEVKVNGRKISQEERSDITRLGDDLEIKLTPRSLLEQTRYRVKVKGWMSNNSGNLDFHRRWNNGVPMPSTEMEGTILGETPGMRRMDLTDADGRHWIGYVSKAAIIEFTEI